jgi:uncharacterized repeat protein (TIGR01451 family)
MRVRLTGLGLLAVAGLLIATVVHRQARSNDASLDTALGWGSARTGVEPLLLADASDSFGASRKMLGSTSYTGTNASGDASARPDNSSQQPNSTSNGNSNDKSSSQPNPTSPNGNSKQPANGDNSQAIFPSATFNSQSGNAQPGGSSRSRTAGDAGDATSSNSGLKALQQRLSSVRKMPSGPTAAGETRSPLVENPGVPVAPSAIMAANPRSQSVGPQTGSGLPKMPEVRAIEPVVETPTVAAAPDPFAARSNETESPSTTIPGGPVVGGPLNMARRPAIGSANAAATVTSAGDGGKTDVISPRATIAPPADPVLFARQSPLMGVETTGPKSITVGKEAAYSVAITNAGDVAAQDVVVSIKIPEWCDVVSAKPTSGTADAAGEQRTEPLAWRLPRLEARSKEQLVVRLVPRASRPFDLAVQWSCSPAVSQAMVEVKEAKLTMTLDGPSEVLYGQTKVYRLTLSNPGTGDAENVVLFLAPVDGGPGAPTRHDVGLVRAGESKSVEVELTARQAGSLAVKAVAVAEGNLRADVAEEILVRRAALKTAANGPELKFAGTPTSFTISVANPGNAPAENIAVAAILPPGAKFLSSNGGQFVESEHKVTWTLSNLRPNAEQEVEFQCTLTAPGANRVQVLATAAGDLNDSAAVTTNVEALADLKLEVTDPPGPLAVGDEMVYEVHIRNRGTKAAENVDVATFFSNGIEPVSAQGGQHDISPGQVVFRPIASIPPGTEAVLKVKARADLPGNHVFRAEVNCASVGAKLASEETTLFYGDGRQATRTATRPAVLAPGQGGGNTAPPINR